MAASEKKLSLENPNPINDWTVVLPRRGKQNRKTHKVLEYIKEAGLQPWTPIDVDTDPKRELKLLQKIELCIQTLEGSKFWCSLVEQMQSPEILDRFRKVLGAEASMPMVIYGIGSIESYEPPRLQLSLAILIKRNFSFIGNIEVFDPIISLIESRVLAAFGCSVLSINEQGRRQALKPTFFYMPHCEAELYDNLLQANWRVELLNRIALFGNSFEEYEYYMSLCNTSTIADAREHILAARNFTKEFGINANLDDFQAFNGSSWHFFCIDSEADLAVNKCDNLRRSFLKIS